MRWTTPWSVVKDVVLTGTGLLLIIVQAFSSQPSWKLLGVGVVLVGGRASVHVGKVVSAVLDGRSESSPSVPPGSSSRELPSPPEVSDD